MKILTILLSSLFASICIAQDLEKFKIQEIIGSFTLPMAAKDFEKMPENQLFEDENYTVTRTCSGEWGGTIIFLNKVSGISYSAAASCPVAVNKINSKYYVTSTLNHIGSFSEFIRIENPEELEIFKSGPRFISEKSVSKIRGSDESHSKKGVKNLMNGQFVYYTALTSCVYQNQLYHILCDDEKTFLAKIEDSTIINIGTISANYLCSTTPSYYTTSENHKIFPFYGEKTEGYYDIFENQITVRRILK